jgi:DNA polymerase elongation subunit (family B)
MDETLDKSVCKQLIKDLQEYDIIMTFYGTKFDIPFVRSRCLSYGLKFPVFGTVKHKDIFYMVRNKMKMHSSSLESACALLGIEGKNHIKGNIWIRAKYGNDKYLKYVQDHCDRDVIITEKLHKRLEDFVRTNSKSI